MPGGWAQQKGTEESLEGVGRMFSGGRVPELICKGGEVENDIPGRVARGRHFQIES